MSEIKTFFRTCPSCGRRFEIKLMSKKLVESQRIKENIPMSGSYFGGFVGSYLLVGETEPAMVDEEVFQHAYKCKHCGHEWQEKHSEEHRES